MTYQELLDSLTVLSSVQLSDTVTIYDPESDEYIAADSFQFTTTSNDVLGGNHPVIVTFSGGPEDVKL